MFLLREKFASLRFAHISLALVGVMWVFPFLHYEHKYPLTTFYHEWWSALLGVLALTLLTTRAYWKQPEVPRIAQLPVALVGIVLLQAALGMIVYFDQALLFILYFLFAALLMLLGAHLRTCIGLERLVLVMSVCVLLGAELNALFGVLQHYRWQTFLNPWVVNKVSSSVYGQLAQPNHFANYMVLGLASLGLLFRSGYVKIPFVVLLAVPLLFVMALSGSRSSWLYLLLMTGLAWWWSRRDAGQRPLLHYGALLMAGFGVMHFVVRLPFFAGVDGTDTIERLFGADATGMVRLRLWYDALHLFLQSPWLGAGFGQFAWQHFLALPELQAGKLTNMYNNAHNVVMQFAAETGLAGVVALLGSLAAWLWQLRRTSFDLAHWWCLVVLGVLAIHSLLEYPLWYVYFLAVVSLLLGMLDQTRYRLELRNAGRLSVAAMLLLGLMTLVQLRAGHETIKEVLQIRPASVSDRANAVKRVRDGLIKVHEESILSPYAEVFMASLIEIDRNHIEQKLELNTRSMHFIPMSMTVYRQAFLLAQAGRAEEARKILELSIWCFPGDFAKNREKLAELAEREPEHFLALLEFGIQKEKEILSAIRQQ